MLKRPYGVRLTLCWMRCRLRVGQQHGIILSAERQWVGRDALLPNPDKSSWPSCKELIDVAFTSLHGGPHESCSDCRLTTICSNHQSIATDTAACNSTDATD